MQSIFDIREYKPVSRMPTVYLNSDIAMLVFLKVTQRKIKNADRIMAAVLLAGVLVCAYFSINQSQVANVNSFAACAGLY